ncbi:DNA photolyase family protein [Luteimonas sp. BDR2-5]|uniref:cryptochrome/photolyase family protein n=1 Tax=Proluteimonas luteida TaxID=2878685 RepID=UPI001E36CD70|nr:deoxyribodipyrimidine photo-lyase [Luteimonas sp. BDR2-5]MCD9026944.1 DNA photolyase family protein [Luteimonas sp. BDR2-5]
MANALVWFRNDLRLDDHPALRAALEAGLAPVCVYIHAPDEEGDWAPGAASDAWRHRSLAALDAALRRRGSRLRLFHGPTLPTLRTLVDTCEAEAVFWNRRYEPAIEQRDAKIKRALRGAGVRAESHDGALLFEPWTLATGQGGPYKVFTPFWRKALASWRLAPPWQAPGVLPKVEAGPHGVALDDLLLRSAHDWDAGFWPSWTPGEAGAHEMLEVFVDGALHGYRQGRERPDQAGTSRLSPHLHFGEIAPWRVAAELETLRSAGTGADIDAFVRQLGWREFAHHLLHHFPTTPSHNFNPRFDGFAWARRNEAQLAAWRAGMTGVPIVDAGMRELWQTGWMHNRVRMVVGSWLCKHMRMHWREGARWFWDTLVDADLANNTLGWQWIAGTGADAAPYFRVFNPVTQAQKCDPDGRYIARWVPELAGLPVPLRFSPWEAPAQLARIAPDYPRRPIVDLAAGRDAALAAYQATR